MMPVYLPVVALAWAATVITVIGLCRMAARGDRALGLGDLS